MCGAATSCRRVSKLSDGQILVDQSAQTCRSQSHAGRSADNIHHAEIRALEVSCTNNDEDWVENCTVHFAYLDGHLKLVR